MSLKQYQEYKSTGVDFYKVAPNHWKVERLSAVAEFQSGKAHEPFITEDGEFICVNSRFVSTRGESVKFCSENLTPTKINDILMVMSDLPNGRALAKGFYVDNEAPYAVNQRVCRIRAINIEPKFLYYYMDRSPVLLCNDDGLNQTHLSNSDFKNCPIFIPSLEEQKSIVSFLEHETTKIDELVAEQQNLIELLKEKRQSVISHAVTKGLNTKAKMKDSGVAWLGEIPEHWVVRSIKHIVSTPVTDGPHETPEFIDEGVPFVSAEAVSSGEVDFTRIRGYISEECHKRYSSKYLPKRGDIFMIKSGATTGITAIVETDQEFNIWSPLAVIRCNRESNPYFVLNFMRSLNFQEAVALNWNFGTQQNIGMGVIENLLCPVPSLEEQKAIADYLTSFTKQFNALSAEANSAIELLKERRSALISAAVTGQIDVRKYQPKEVA
jgi:type I restriction enzyme S subunit